ncbi:MAG: Ig domain-containing protein [Lysobacterales bacterium]
MPARWFLNRPFSLQLQGNGGASPYSFAVVSGALPPGITLSPAGLLSGTPNTTGDYVFVVSVTDANGFSSTREIRAGVFPAPVMVPANSLGGLLGLILLMLGVGALALRSVGRSD